MSLDRRVRRVEERLLDEVVDEAVEAQHLVRLLAREHGDGHCATRFDAALRARLIADGRSPTEDEGAGEEGSEP